MEVHLVLTTYSHFEGEPLGIFSSNDLAESFIAENEKQNMPKKGLRIWPFEVDEEVKSKQKVTDAVEILKRRYRKSGTFFEVVCPGMELVNKRWHWFLKGWLVGTIGIGIGSIIYSLWWG